MQKRGNDRVGRNDHAIAIVLKDQSPIPPVGDQSCCAAHPGRRNHYRASRPYLHSMRKLPMANILLRTSMSASSFLVSWRTSCSCLSKSSALTCLSSFSGGLVMANSQHGDSQQNHSLPKDKGGDLCCQLDSSETSALAMGNLHERVSPGNEDRRERDPTRAQSCYR